MEWVVRDLQRELKWLLDDVVAAARGPDPLAPWRDTSWDAVLRSASGQPSAGAYHSMTGPIAESKHASLRLRAGVNELKDLWDRRVNDRTPLQVYCCSQVQQDISPSPVVSNCENRFMKVMQTSGDIVWCGEGACST